jgi:hypothetical protein
VAFSFLGCSSSPHGAFVSEKEKGENPSPSWGFARLVPHRAFSNSSTHAPHAPTPPLTRARRPPTVTDTMPRITLWPRCRQVDVVLAGPQPPAGTALPCGPQCPTVQNLNRSGERKGFQSLEEQRGGVEAEAEAMLRGGGSRTSAKPRRPHSRQRPPSPPAPSRRGESFRSKRRPSFPRLRIPFLTKGFCFSLRAVVAQQAGLPPPPPPSRRSRRCWRLRWCLPWKTHR